MPSSMICRDIHEQPAGDCRKQHPLRAGRVAQELKRVEAQLEQNNRELQALSTSERKQRMLAETISEASMSIANSLDLDKVLNTMLFYIPKLVDYDEARILLIQGELQLEVRAVQSRSRDACSDKCSGMILNIQTEPVLGEFFLSNHSILYSNTRLLPHWPPLP